MFKKLTMSKLVILMTIFISVFSFSKDYWEKRNFTVKVTQDVTNNGQNRRKRYIMIYN